MDMWARRKASVAAEAEADARAHEQVLVAEAQAELAEKPDDVILAELDLPDPDQMQPGDDFSAFMKAAVPERLRNRALRKLWLSNPVLANVDNLLEYGEDFTGGGILGEAIASSYQVGKGMLAHVKEMERQALEQAAAKAAKVDGAEVEGAEGAEVEGAEEDGAAELLAAEESAEVSAEEVVEVIPEAIPESIPESIPVAMADCTADTADAAGADGTADEITDETNQPPPMTKRRMHFAFAS